MSTIGLSSDARQQLKRMTLEATVTRADGTVEHLGVVADSSRFARIRRSLFGR